MAASTLRQADARSCIAPRRDVPHFDITVASRVPWMSMTAAQREAIEKMLSAVASARLERWLYLLGRDPSKWGKISPIDVWPLPSEYDSYPDKPIAEVLLSSPLAKYLDKEVLVLRCGHTRNPGISAMKLRDVYPQGERDFEIIFEGFVCIDPGKIAIAENHEGGTYVYGI